MNKSIAFIKNHPYQFLIGVIATFASLVTILNWMNLTSNVVFNFLKLRIITLTIPEFIIILTFIGFLSYRFFAKRYPLISSKVLKNIKERAILLKDFPTTSLPKPYKYILHNLTNDQKGALLKYIEKHNKRITQGVYGEQIAEDLEEAGILKRVKSFSGKKSYDFIIEDWAFEYLIEHKSLLSKR